MPTSRTILDDDDLLDWRLEAACADLPARSVFTTRANQAGLALSRCTRCPVRAQCLAAVEPERSWFDGVCGGLLWRNGRVIGPPGSVPARVARTDTVNNADTDTVKSVAHTG